MEYDEILKRLNMASHGDQVPDFLTRSELISFHLAAQKDLLSCPLPESEIAEEEMLNSWFSAWFDQSKELYQYLSANPGRFANSRTEDQLMALGSFRAFLGLAMNALSEAENRRFR